MADSGARKEFIGIRPDKKRREPVKGPYSTGLTSTDTEKLRAVRGGIQIHLNGVVSIANRIHDPEMRDAALGNIIKRHARNVLVTPARMSHLKYEVDALLEITDMMGDAAKRASMFAFVKKLTSPEK